MKKDQREEKKLLIKQLGVFELRGLARELGIISPTTKKRDELIELILNKFDEGNIIDSNGKRKGRPCKKLSAIDDILNTLVNEFQNSEDNPLVFENILTFAQVIPNFTQNNNSEQIISEGIVRINNKYKQYYDIVKQVWVFIKEDIAFFDKLKNGDKVKAIVCKTENQHQYLAVKILKINDILSEEYFTKSFFKGEEIISSNKMPYSKDKVIFEGRRNSLKIENDIYENDDFKNLSVYCKENKIKLVVLGINTSFENQIYFKNIEFDNFTTKYGSSNETNFNCIIDSIQYVEKLSNDGENVLFYILDIYEILRVIDKCFVKEDEEDGHSKQSIVVSKKILSLGMAYQNGGNISLLIGYNENDCDDKFLKQDILKISKKIN